MTDSAKKPEAGEGLSNFLPLVNKASQDAKTNLFHDIMLAFLYAIIFAAFRHFSSATFSHEGFAQFMLECIAFAIFLFFVIYCFFYQVIKKA
jgi:cation transporter-like permease